MNTQSLQTILVTAIVLISAILAARHLAPNAFRLLQSRLARILGRPQHGAFLRAIGRWLQPLEAKQAGCGSGSGCASCAGCGSAGAKPLESIPLKFHSQPLQRH